MKYKVGDKVKIKSLEWYKKMLSRPSKLSWINRQDGFFEGIRCGSRVFTDAMCKFCGKVMTIQEVDTTFYLMEEDKIGYDFTDEMIEDLVDESKEKTIEGLFECNVTDASEMDEHMMRMPTMTTPNDICEHVKDAACKVFQEMLVELCPELLGYGVMAVEWENEFRKRLEEQI